MLAAIVPGSLTAISGGSLYDRHLVEGLRAAGHAVTVIEAAGSFPAPSGDAIAALDTALAALPDHTATIVDGLIFGAVPEVVARHTSRLRFVALVHLPLAADPSAPRAAVAGRREAESRALAHAQRVVVTGTRTLALLDGYGVPATRLAVIEPGTHRPEAAAAARAVARRAEPHDTVHVLSVGTVNPIKGHDRLLHALSRVEARWHLTCAGSLEAAPATVAEIRALARALNCENRVTFTGVLTGSALADAYAAADVFALATRMETYGMAVAEALAWGLPVVATGTGAIGDLVEPDAGVVVPVEDDVALTEAIRAVVTDAGLRARLSTGAAAAARRLPSWHDQVRAFAALLDTL